MDLPSTRELELEAFIKQRDAQLAILTVRLYFSLRSPGEAAPPITEPPA